LTNPLIYYAIRTDNAFLMCGLRCCPWTPTEYEVVINLAVAEEGHAHELVKLFRESIAWGKRRNATTWLFYSDIDRDFSPLMRRLGAREQPRFTLRLKED
jgi:hypothetical protein